MKTRSLYDCSHARYPVPPNDCIICRKGHKLGTGIVHADAVARGDKLVYRACAVCPDFDDMNDPVEVGALIDQGT